MAWRHVVIAWKARDRRRVLLRRPVAASLIMVGMMLWTELDGVRFFYRELFRGSTVVVPIASGILAGVLVLERRAVEMVTGRSTTLSLKQTFVMWGIVAAAFAVLWFCLTP